MHQIQDPKREQQPIEIDFFRDEDAAGIARLFRDVYGEHYPIRIYYEPEQLIAENAGGRIISCVARTADGEVVGHDALVLMDAEAHLYENAAGAVSSAFRGYGIFPRLFKFAIVETGKRFGVAGIIGEPVCSHTHLQKMCLQLGFRESGLEMDLMPTGAYGMQPQAGGRVSVLLGFFRINSQAQTVRVPIAYREQIQCLYADLQLERTFAPAGPEPPTEGVSQGSLRLFDQARVARISVEGVGSDFSAFMARLEDQAREKGVLIFQVWLPLSCVFAGAATDILRRNGYFFGGMLPRGRQGDCLLMQKVGTTPDWDNLALYSDKARKIAAMVKADWQRVNPAG